MYNFILQILIMFSLGAIIYLIARVAPRVGDIEESFKKEIFHQKLDKLIARVPSEKMDVFFIVNLEKTLRKMKLLLMKWDNLLTNHLRKLKKSGSGVAKEEKQSLFASLTETDENKKEEEK